MSRKPEFKGILEFMMTEALRRGVSQHLAEITPCVAYDLQKILTMGHMALGEYFYMDINFCAKFPESERRFNIFNDENFLDHNIRREHLIYLSCEVICIASEAIIQPEAKKWMGERSITQIKSKKKYTFVGREEQESYFCKMVLNNKCGTFKGLKDIPDVPPTNAFKLWPIKSFPRTIFG